MPSLEQVVGPAAAAGKLTIFYNERRMDNVKAMAAQAEVSEGCLEPPTPEQPKAPSAGAKSLTAIMRGDGRKGRKRRRRRRRPLPCAPFPKRNILAPTFALSEKGCGHHAA